MNIENDLLEVMTQVRMHLELQRALGASFVGTFSGTDAPAPPVPVPSPKKDPPAAPIRTELPGLDAVREEVITCTRCGLSSRGKKPVIGEGNPASVVVFVGAAPGKEEDGRGRLFAGPDGQLLTDIIVKGMKLRCEDVYVCTLLKCRPDNGKALPDEIEACEGFLARQLRAIRPGIIVTLGPVATRAMLKRNDEFADLRGKWHEYEGSRLMPTLEPAHLVKNAADKKIVWEDIKKVIAEMEKLKQR